MNPQQTIKSASSVAVIAGVFTFLVALLMLLNYYRMKVQDPLELQSLQTLVERLKDEPNNEELREEIRNLDLLARKAYFTSQWQVRTGRYLLLFGGIVWGFAMRYYFSARSKISEPVSGNTTELIARSLSQRWVAIAASLVLVLAFAASFGIRDHLELYQAGPAGEGPADQSIEVIKVADRVLVDSSGGPGTTTGRNTGKASEGAVSGTGFENLVMQNHNMFRGPYGRGVSAQKGIPVDWDGATGRNVIWKRALSEPGYNSPILWGDKLFAAGADATTQVVYCLDRNSGEIIWQTGIRDVPGSPATPPGVTDDTGLSAPSMTTDGIRVYVMYGTGDMAALGMDGKIVWVRNLGVPENHYGHSSSLLTWENRLLIQYDTNKGGRVLSIDTRTGEIQWDRQRDAGISWASPILAKIGGTYQVILNSAPIVAGYDISNGKELWSHECMMGEVGPSPAFDDGLVYATNEYARLIALKPGNPVTVVWEDDEYMPEVASPVVSEGLLFIGTSYGILVCYDAKDGTKYWEDMMDNGFYSSPMIADGKVYAMDMGGTMHIYELNREKKKIAEPALGERCVSTPAFAGGRIYIRGNKYLYCIGK